MQGFEGVPENTPVYKLLAPCYLDDTLWPVDMEIAYSGVPNEFMAPMNDPAREKMRDFLLYLDDCAREKAALNGRPFSGRPRELADQLDEAMGDAKREARKQEIVMPIASGDIPLRPDLVPVGQRGRGRPANKVLGSNMPAPSARPKQIQTIGSTFEGSAGSNSTL